MSSAIYAPPGGRAAELADILAALRALQEDTEAECRRVADMLARMTEIKTRLRALAETAP